MTLTAEALPDSAPLSRDLLGEVRASRRESDAAEVRIMVLGVEFAYANPALPGQEAWQPAAPPSWLNPESYAETDPDDVEWHGIPAVRWDAPAAFAAANAMTTTAGKAVIRDGLVLKHRAPGVWAAMLAGMIPVWRARKVAQALLGQHDDVCAYVNRELTERLETNGAIGPIVLERLVDEAMLRLHAEERELDQLEALDRRHVTIDPRSINHNGIADLDASADCVDLFNLDETLSALAEAIKHLPQHQHESLDVRRSIALTVRPIRHCGGRAGGCTTCPADIDCDNHTRHALEDYVPSRLDREIVELAAKTCAHPYCNRPARQCDCDHIKPFDSGGVTCPKCNLAPECRHHHRLKTHAGWRYWKLTPDTYLWIDSHGLIYLRTRDGTRQLD